MCRWTGASAASAAAIFDQQGDARWPPGSTSIACAARRAAADSSSGGRHVFMRSSFEGDDRPRERAARAQHTRRARRAVKAHIYGERGVRNVGSTDRSSLPPPARARLECGMVLERRRDERHERGERLRGGRAARRPLVGNGGDSYS